MPWRQFDASGALFAEDILQHPGGLGKFADMDENMDGVLSFAEWKETLRLHRQVCLVFVSGLICFFAQWCRVERLAKYSVDLCCFPRERYQSEGSMCGTHNQRHLVQVF